MQRMALRAAAQVQREDTMAKRRTSQAPPPGTIRKTDLAKILREIQVISDADTPAPLAAAGAPRPGERARNRALRRKVGGLLVKKAEIKKAEALIAQYNKDSAARFRKETVAARTSFLSSRKKSRARVTSPLDAATSGQFTEFGTQSAQLLLKPIAVVTRPTGMLWDTQALGSTGLAKIFFSDDQQSSDTLTLEFWYFWTNATTSEVRVNVRCPLLFNGQCATHADIGLFFGGQSLIDINAELEIYEWWKVGHPSVTGGRTFDTYQHLLNEYTGAGGVWGDNAAETYRVQEYKQLLYGRLPRGTLAVPVGGGVMMRVKVHFFYSISGSGGFLGGGFISFDFASQPSWAIVPTMMLNVFTTVPLDPNP
jgi:hypothetical protein